MVCPKCKRDLYDVPKGHLKGYVYRVDPSDDLKEIRRGRVCTNCNICFETVEKATGNLYHKRAAWESPNQLKMFDEKK